MRLHLVLFADHPRRGGAISVFNRIKAILHFAVAVKNDHGGCLNIGRIRASI
jgi:hypothetical protein